MDFKGINDFGSLLKSFPATSKAIISVKKYDSKKKSFFFEDVSGDEYLYKIRAYALCLKKNQVKDGTKIAFMIKDSFTFDVLEKAALGLGSFVIAINPFCIYEKVEEIIAKTKPDAIFFDDFTLKGAELFNNKKHIKIFKIGSDLSNEQNLNFIDFEEAVKSLSLNEIRNFAFEKVDSERDAIVTFTSGTTGEQKGILYTHKQYLLAAKSISNSFGGAQKTVSWLPLENLFQRVANLASLISGHRIIFTLDPKEIIEDIKKIEPTLLIGVPFFFDKIYKAVNGKFLTLPSLIYFIYRKALSWTYDVKIKRDLERKISFLNLKILQILNKILWKEIKKNICPGLIFFISGSAPCSIDILKFFYVIDIPIYEAYGISENIVPIALNTPDFFRHGSVGKIIAQNDVRIIDNEIIVKGEGVANKYLENRADKKHLSINSFLHTGDEGFFDEDGFLYLTGRKSDIIKISKGVRISPFRIEQRFKSIENVQDVIVMGHGKPWLLAIVTNSGAGDNFNNYKLNELTKDVKRVNLSLDMNEKIRAIIVTGKVFTQGDELTNNLKLKRSFIIKKYSDIIQKVYTDYSLVDSEKGVLVDDNILWTKVS